MKAESDKLHLLFQSRSTGKSMRNRTVVLMLLLLCVAFRAASQTKIPAPAEVLGFAPGEDRKLASWTQVIDYFERLDKASDRVVFQTLGQTTMGKPFVMATISSPANLARLEEFKKIQDQLADPRKHGPLPMNIPEYANMCVLPSSM